jgi:hypothetical protein
MSAANQQVCLQAFQCELVIKAVLDALMKSTINDREMTMKLNCWASYLIELATASTPTPAVTLAPLVRTTLAKVNDILGVQRVLFSPVQKLDMQTAMACLWCLQPINEVEQKTMSPMEAEIKRWFVLVSTSEQESIAKSAWSKLVAALGVAANARRTADAVGRELGFALEGKNWGVLHHKLFSLKTRNPEAPQVAHAEKEIDIELNNTYSRFKHAFATANFIQFDVEGNTDFFKFFVPDAVKEVLEQSRLLHLRTCKTRGCKQLPAILTDGGDGESKGIDFGLSVELKEIIFNLAEVACGFLKCCKFRRRFVFQYMMVICACFRSKHMLIHVCSMIHRQWLVSHSVITLLHVVTIPSTSVTDGGVGVCNNDVAGSNSTCYPSCRSI